jgi:lipooligosaccharide transport system permease protein
MSWAATKGLFSACCVVLVGVAWGGVASLSGALLALPVLALGAVCFASCGLVATAHARTWDVFAYFFTFWVTPMFMFSGTFFEVTRFPWFVQWVAWALPMTHLIAVVRPLTAGLALDPWTAGGHLAYVSILAIAAFSLARHRFGVRLFG